MASLIGIIMVDTNFYKNDNFMCTYPRRSLNAVLNTLQYVFKYVKIIRYLDKGSRALVALTSDSDIHRLVEVPSEQAEGRGQKGKNKNSQRNYAVIKSTQKSLANPTEKEQVKSQDTQIGSARWSTSRYFKYYSHAPITSYNRGRKSEASFRHRLSSKDRAAIAELLGPQAKQTESIDKSEKKKKRTPRIMIDSSKFSGTYP